MTERSINFLLVAFIAIAVITVSFLIYGVAVSVPPEERCINGVVMYKTKSGWISDSGKYVRFCSEEHQ